MSDEYKTLLNLRRRRDELNDALRVAASFRAQAEYYDDDEYVPGGYHDTKVTVICEELDRVDRAIRHMEGY